MKFVVRKEKGFTLIELLVVISVIGLLASIILVSLNGAREKAKIARAKQDVQAIRTALILYSEANGGAFPGVDFRCNGADASANHNLCDEDAWNSGWFHQYISYVPLDPWGQPYFFDGVPTQGFDNDASECGPWGTAIYSSGPNKVLEVVNGPGPAGDDIAAYFDSPSICSGN